MPITLWRRWCDVAHKMQTNEKRRHISWLAYVPDDAVEWTAEGYKVIDEDKVLERYEQLCAGLDGLRVKCCISPLHNLDRYDEQTVNKWRKNHADKNGEISDEDAARMPKVGDVKKPHWHVYYYSGGGRMLSGLHKLFDKVAGYSPTFWVEDDKETAIRYQAHLDSPSKAAYNPADVQAFGGLDISCLWKADGLTKLTSLEAICAYISEEECTNGFDLTNAIIRMEDPTLFDCLVSRVSFVAFYMDGLQQKLNRREKMANEGKA